MLTDRYVILIEDDAIMGGSLVQRLELEGADVTWVKQATRGLSAVRTPLRRVDAVICDIRLPDGTGEDVFAAISRTATPPPFLFITGQGEIDQAVRLLRGGAADYITKPFEMRDFLERLALVVRNDRTWDLPPETGITPAARQVDALVEDFAKHDMPVLIRAQRGLGKARIARRIHDLSDRRAAPFVAYDALREEADDEAFAAAADAAGDGTFFISGVGHLAGCGQERLVRALGSAGFRLIAACGNRISEKVEDGGFRSDLHYALIANEIFVPPLSQRREDAAWFAMQVFLANNARRATPLHGLSDLAMAAIRDHDWPGNGREVRSRLLRAIDVAQGDWIFPSDVFPDLGAGEGEPGTLAQARDRAERRQIFKALEKTGGQVARAARLLGVSRTTLWEKMQKLGL